MDKSGVNGSIQLIHGTDMVEITIAMIHQLCIWNCAPWLMPVGPEKSSRHDYYLFRRRGVGNSYPGYTRPKLLEITHFDSKSPRCRNNS
jgi:hypothetical protein